MTRRKIVLSFLGSVGSVVVDFGILNYVNNRIDNIFFVDTYLVVWPRCRPLL